MVSIKNIACESYFYDKPNEAEQRIEKALSEMESSFKPIQCKILGSEDLGSLTSSERESLAYFVMAQELRTREKRETIRDMMKRAKKRLYKEKLTDAFKVRYGIDKWDKEEEIKALHLSTFNNIPLYANILLQMKWVIFINRTPIPFWSSDHPINRYNPVDARPRGNLGLLCKGIEIHFPLSPKIILSFSDPLMHSLLLHRYELKDIQCVIFENSLQVSYSTRYIFSNTDDFSLAKEILQEHPSLRNIDRKRIEVH